MNTLAGFSGDLPEGISRTTMHNLPFALVLADARADDLPLVYVNKAFEDISGYSSKAILGRNCRFLQGPDTRESSKEEIRKALKAKREISIDILNYRANGERFVNRLMITPLTDDSGEVTHFLGIQAEREEDLSFEGRAKKLDESLMELQHRVKNHLALLLSLIRLEARRADGDTRVFETLAARVESLNLLYDEFSRGGGHSGDTVGLGAYVSRICSALNMLDGLHTVALNISAERMDAPVNNASQIGLLVSELLTNSLQHGFTEEEGGTINVSLAKDPETGEVLLSVEDDGRGLPEGSKWPEEGNLGARIVRDLANRLGGKLIVDNSGKGLSVLLRIPPSILEEEA